MATDADPVPRTIADAIQQDSDELKSQQQLVAELKFLRTDNAEKAKEILNLKGELAVSAKIMKVVEERGDFFKTAAEKGIKAGDNCGLIQERFERIVAEERAERERLRSENDRLRDSRNNRALLSGGIGAGIGYAFCSRGR